MTRDRLIGAAVVLVLLAIAGNAYLGVQNSSAISDEQTRLARTQHTIEVSQKASTHTRVATVQQRCELTGLLVAVVTKQDRVVAPPFQQSLSTCRRQLLEVTRIDARTPNPR